MAKIIFNTYTDYNQAKELDLKTIVIGEPIIEIVDGLLTGRFIVDHQFTQAQHEELASHGLLPLE